MINGFVLDIRNTSSLQKCVRLFSDKELPEGVSISYHRQDIDYKALCAYALKDGFMGDGININEKLEFTIHQNAISETYVTKLLTDKKMVVDGGGTNFITVNLPPNAKVMFQLMPLFE
jgi:hypothetical protein